MFRFTITPLLIILFFWAIAQPGCASTSEEIKSPGNNETTEFIHKWEKTFNPSEYDVEAGKEIPDQKNQNPRIEQENPPLRIEGSELVSGFRIQVSFTENIEAANQLKNEVSPLLPQDQVYVVYEPPYYKVRVGDFLSRPEANLTLRTLVEKGYKDAWIVPDKVRKGPER